MTRPKSIIWFERLYLLAIAIEIVRIAIDAPLLMQALGVDTLEALSKQTGLSPAEILSPGCLCHLTIVPAVIVGDKDGIFSGVSVHIRKTSNKYRGINL